ncbi:MAG: L-ascorbate metabolism protein UlaG (beta-lactamase superfamily) [Cryomorphaceae bacterium]|jgi:L-ascorbate metabolism protein UlaG (beta-lactamase superfamily)
MTLTHYGHSCFGINHNDYRILFDPFISPNPLAAHIDIEKIEVDFILITHGHFDHIADAVAIAKRTGAKVISNFEIYQWLGKQGVENVHPMNHGGAVQQPFGKVKYVNAVHSSALDDGTYMGNPGGFVIDFGDLCIYYAGDTALTYDMKLIAREFDVNWAFMPIGDTFTMGVDDAIIASEFVDVKNIIGMHYNTFPPITIDLKEAKNKFAQAGLDLRLMEIGETIEL